MIPKRAFSPTGLRTRTSCRICGSNKLAPVLDLGEQCISGAFAEPGGEDPITRTIPLELVRCDMTADQDACGLIQTRHTVPGSILYRSYWYRSGVNQTMTKNLHEIAQQARGLATPTAGDIIVDIGCNDGTLFDGYHDEHLRFLGFDPSDVAQFAVDKGYEVIRDFFSFGLFKERYPDHKAKIITSIAMFYDLEEPGAFVSDIASTLAENGVWVLELHYLPTMLEQNSFDAIVHEHLEYYSLSVIERLVYEAGLEIVHAEINDVNGGSVRVFVGHQGRHLQTDAQRQSLQALRVSEFEMALDSPDPYAAFARRVERVRDELSALCRSLHADGQSIHVYGASTKGNTILQYTGLDRSVIEYAADRNPAKWGSRTIRTGIPIISEEESRGMRPDCYLVLPWHFLDEFLEREADYLRGGGRFIVPLPEVRVIEG